MKEVIALIVAILFLFLSGLHFYWAVFGIAKPELVLPKIPSQEKPKLPGALLTLAVALGLLVFAVVFINQFFKFWNFDWLEYVPIVVGIIFLVRAIGDFKYVGLFKSIKEGLFAKMDTKYYSPLCLIIGILILLGEFVR